MEKFCVRQFSKSKMDLSVYLVEGNQGMKLAFKLIKSDFTDFAKFFLGPKYFFLFNK